MVLTEELNDGRCVWGVFGGCVRCRTYHSGRQAAPTLPAVCPSLLTPSRKRNQSPHSPIIAPSNCHLASFLQNCPFAQKLSLFKSSEWVGGYLLTAAHHICITWTGSSCIIWMVCSGCFPEGDQPRVIGSSADNPIIIHHHPSAQASLFSLCSFPSLRAPFYNFPLLLAPPSLPPPPPPPHAPHPSPSSHSPPPGLPPLHRWPTIFNALHCTYHHS